MKAKTNEIRTALKNELGLNRTHVSVKSRHYGSIDVTIKTVQGWEVRDAIEEIAKRQEKVHRCDVTHEILSGGNTFVSVEIDRDLKEEIAAPYLEVVEKALEERVNSDNVREGVEIVEGAYLFGNSWDIRLSVNGGMVGRFYNQNSAVSIAYELACKGIEITPTESKEMTGTFTVVESEEQPAGTSHNEAVEVTKEETCATTQPEKETAVEATENPLFTACFKELLSAQDLKDYHLDSGDFQKAKEYREKELKLESILIQIKQL